VSYFKWGIVPAGAAFLVSSVLGVIFGVNFFYIIMRGLVFAFLFFGFGFALRFLINSFFPEFLVSSEDGAEDQYSLEQPPSRENAVIDTMGEYAVPELYKTPGESSELGNIEDLVSGAFSPPTEGVDRNEEEGYNRGSVQSVPEMRFESSGPLGQEDSKFPDMFQDLFPDTAAYEEPRPEMPKKDKPVFTPSFGDDSGGLGGLPDLDSMAMAFGGSEANPISSASAFDGVGETADAGGGTESPRYAGNKPQPMEGDFNPKELAEGIRTVLKKDK